MGNIRHNTTFRATVLSTTLLSAMAASVPFQAHAADLLVEPPVIEAPVVEAASSGWYLRGDITYDWQDIDGPYAYSNAGPGGGPAKYKNPVVDDAMDIGIGIGYQVTDFLRVDATAEYIFEADFSGELGCFTPGSAACPNGHSTETATVSTLKLMANAYADLGHFNGLTPYIGAGIGGAHVSYEDYAQDVATFPASQNHKDEKSWRFAYALHAGVAYDITQSLKFDVGYSYTSIEGGALTGYDITNPNSHPQAYDDGFDSHTVRAGLRYQFH